MDLIVDWDDYLNELMLAARLVDVHKYNKVYDLLIETYRQGRKVFICGNGGSASISEHFACDHFKGVAEGGGISPKVISLSSNFPLISALANDKSYGEIYSYQILGLAEHGDVLCVVSSSGNSENIIKAIQAAKQLDLKTIGFVGFEGGEVIDIVDIAIHVPSNNYGIVEDIHQMVMHSLAQRIRLNTIKD